MTKSHMNDEHRYLPRTLMSAKTWTTENVISSTFFPSMKHLHSPIKNGLGAVRVLLANGAVRWFGATDAYINSELRMVVVGHNPRDEVRAKWVVVSPNNTNG